MANEEHLTILRQGVKVWNEWRQKNSEVAPDLTDINLSGAFLIGIDFSNSNLSRANLSHAVLVYANLSAAIFRKSNLSNINLSRANLEGADLDNANLDEAFLQNAYLKRVNFSGASLKNSILKKSVISNAIFCGADLTLADLSETEICNANFAGLEISGNIVNCDLSGTNLTMANLSNAYLYRSNFSKANLTKANLTKAFFVDAVLWKANFTEALLCETNLKTTKAISANFNNATLTGACIEDWIINSITSFEGVNCEYVYLEEYQKERRPSSGNFAPGEFTKLFQKSLETVDLIFRNGIDWDAFAYSFKKLEVENQGAQLDVQSIEKKGDGILVVRVAVAPDADKAKIHSDFMQGYEFAAKALEAQYQARLEDKDTLISKQEAQINRLFDIVEQQGSVQKALVENPRKVSNYNMQNPQFASGIVDANNVNTDQIGGNIQNNDA
ncbi:pentapeptide repeat-containing protein (plasmid) [Nostoc sp. C052]|uniref:pentapeptide repeat-containing protein n=1 Tax=Nostoc sp. C052 TaxID=2576902 RepID=UPI0015C30ADF|nr:pentapeptide repeat-containing protein [Nostoc sp. C052]QLE45280.1 pentapeptide repeat-containing protein [Nostoc sp. C052]